MLHGPSILGSMYKTIVSIISNSMPYVKDLSKNSCDQLMKMLRVMTKRMKLSPENAYGVGNILEAINYSLSYQDGHNEFMRIALISH